MRCAARMGIGYLNALHNYMNIYNLEAQKKWDECLVYHWEHNARMGFVINMFLAWHYKLDEQYFSGSCDFDEMTSIFDGYALKRATYTDTKGKRCNMMMFSVGRVLVSGSKSMSDYLMKLCARGMDIRKNATKISEITHELPWAYNPTKQGGNKMASNKYRAKKKAEREGITRFKSREIKDDHDWKTVK